MSDRISELEALDEQLQGDEDMLQQLVNHRGGCSCHLSPPCYTHSDPLTLDEALDLGWLE